jgi:hypothetical protein
MQDKSNYTIFSTICINSKINQKIPEKKNEPMEGTMPIITNVIALMEEQPTEAIQLDQIELISKPETPHNSLDRHRFPLPLELNCQIFECLIKSDSSEKIHLRLGQRNLWNIPSESPHKGSIKN